MANDGINEETGTMPGKLIIFSAPSGSGKTTLVRHLLKSLKGLRFSVSATSRPPRDNEVHGKDYYFLSGESFREKIEQGAFLEWEEVYPGQYYGTLRSEVDRLLEQGFHVLFDIDVEGGLNLKRYYGVRALAVFVRPPSLEVMEERLRARGTDNEEQLKKRLKKAGKEMEYASQFDRILVNDQLDEARREAVSLVRRFTTLHP